MEAVGKGFPIKISFVKLKQQCIPKRRGVSYVQCVNIFRMYFGLLGHLSYQNKRLKLPLKYKLKDAPSTAKFIRHKHCIISQNECQDLWFTGSVLNCPKIIHFISLGCQMFRICG